MNLETLLNDGEFSFV